MDSSDMVMIEGWMVSKLGLSGKRLLAFAVVNSFTHTSKWYDKGTSYIAEIIGLGKRQAQEVLKSLYDDGLLIRSRHDKESSYRYRVPPIYEDNTKGWREQMERYLKNSNKSAKK